MNTLLYFASLNCLNKLCQLPPPPPRCPVALPLDAPGYFRLFVVCIGTSQAIQGNHIRFDSEENTNTSTDALNDAILPLTHPRILSIRGVATPSPHGTPNLSPIEPDMENGFSGEKSVNGSNNNVNKQKGGKGVKRKDSYTNRSKIMESTRVEKDVQQQVRLLGEWRYPTYSNFFFDCNRNVAGFWILSAVRFLYRNLSLSPSIL